MKINILTLFMVVTMAAAHEETEAPTTSPTCMKSMKMMKMKMKMKMTNKSKQYDDDYDLLD